MGRVKLGAADDELVVTAASSSQPAGLPLNQMQPNPENPRPSDLEIDEMAADLGERGQLQNVNVMSRACFTAQKPHLADLVTAPFIVVNGCRRLAGARKAGLSRLRHEVHDEWTTRQIDEAMITENVHRLDLNPLLLGRQLKRMLPNYDNSQRQLAKALNKQQPWVSQRISLTELHPDLQAAIETGAVRFKTARECTRLHPDLQPLLASGELPEEIAQAWLVRLRIKPDAQLARWTAGPPYLDDRALPSTPPAAGGEYPVFTPGSGTINGAGAPSVPGTDPAASRPQGQQPAVGEYPVFAHGDESTATGGGSVSSPPPNPSTDTKQRSRAGMVIRVSDRSPAALADALRAELTPDEVTQLVKALRSSRR